MRKQSRAFTLVELLVALAITSVLVVLLANVVNATLSAWQQGRNRLDTFSNARQLIGRMQDEISAAIAAKSRMQFVENSDDLKDPNDKNPDPVKKVSENVFFVTPYPNTGSGDLCVVEYRLNSAEHLLERRFKGSLEAWNASSTTDRYKTTGYLTAGANEWRVVAAGVIEFEIRSYSQEDLDLNHDYDKGQIADSWDSAKSGDAIMEGKTPRRVVLRLKVVDDRTLVRLAGMAVDSPAYQDLVSRAGREFFADFSLPSR